MNNVNSIFNRHFIPKLFDKYLISDVINIIYCDTSTLIVIRTKQLLYHEIGNTHNQSTLLPSIIQTQIYNS